MIYPNDHPPAHVHVWRGDDEARVLLDPVEVLNSRGYGPRELSTIVEIVRSHQAQLASAWRDIHGEG